MRNLIGILLVNLLAACAPMPSKNGGFTCTHVQLRESYVAGHKVLQESCTRWERKADEIPQKPDSIWYKDIG